MKNIVFSICFLAAGVASATDLNVSVQSGGQNTVFAFPGQAIGYQVRGELSNNLNEGLAMFSLNLSFSGGPLAQAGAPGSNPMLNFATPLGLNNPAGFGGTVIGGNLIQVGGAQNTINNFFAPYPAGSVITGVAWPGSPVILASGSLTAPANVGTYTLSASSLFANVIKQGETGSPFWHVEGANAGSNAGLTVVVQALTANVSTVSVSALNPKQILSLNAGTANAGRIYWLVGSVSGTTPGLQVSPSTHLPLNYDGYMQFTITNPNTPLLSNSLSTLDGQGKATAVFTLPHVSPSLIGITVNHAFALVSPVNYASNPIPVTLVP